MEAPSSGLAPAPVLPPELQGHRPAIQAYVTARLWHFGGVLLHRLLPTLPRTQAEQLIAGTMADIARNNVSQQRSLRLVLRHVCQSTGCREAGCLLCQNNPSRMCERNVKTKYLVDDHLKAKCGAPLLVELVDDQARRVSEGLPSGMHLEAHVLNGEKHKELCPENTVLSHDQLCDCFIAHHTAPLLRRDNADQPSCNLQLETGQCQLAGLQVTTSSEKLLQGKAPTFRLLLWAVDSQGEPQHYVAYALSEGFVVATQRVKHAVKSDIPTTDDHVKKLVHIGKVTAQKLMNLRKAARAESMEMLVPEELNRVASVGVFRELVALADTQQELKNKLCHLLKLSLEKWNKVAAHAQAAVVLDFKRRVWWPSSGQAGLLFPCKQGAVRMDNPEALLIRTSDGGEEQVVPLGNLDAQLYGKVAELRESAKRSWLLPQHPGG
ncbi:hypothetical protein V8C86DRAFT_3017440 [Haematococcus lacustris]